MSSSQYLTDIMNAGKKILEDTKAPRRIVKKAEKPNAASQEPTDNDPHKVLIRRTIQEKPKKSDLIDEFKRFIDSAEAL
jgi:hypothetical protein